MDVSFLQVNRLDEASNRFVKRGLTPPTYSNQHREMYITCTIIPAKIPKSLFSLYKHGDCTASIMVSYAWYIIHCPTPMIRSKVDHLLHTSYFLTVLSVYSKCKKMKYCTRKPKAISTGGVGI